MVVCYGWMVCAQKSEAKTKVIYDGKESKCVGYEPTGSDRFVQTRCFRLCSSGV